MFREALALKKSPAMISQQGSDMAFPWKLHEMLDRIERDDKQAIVSWMPSGKSFKVHKREAFSKEILPLYFRHSNFKSFQRNLSIYQFTRIWSGPERGSYQHAHFFRGHRHLCSHIIRRGAKTTSSPDGSPVSRPEERELINQHVPRNYLGHGGMVLDNDGTSNDIMQEAWNMLSEEDSTDNRFVSISAHSNPTYDHASPLSTGGAQQNNDSLANNDATTIAWMLKEGVSTSDLMEIMMGVNNKKSLVPRQSIQAYSDDIISLFSNNVKAMVPTAGAPIVPSASAPSNSRGMHMHQWLSSQSPTTDSMMVRLLRTGSKHFDKLPQQQQGASQQLTPLVSLTEEEQPFVFPSTRARTTSDASVGSLGDLGNLGFVDMADDNDGEPLTLNPWEV